MSESAKAKKLESIGDSESLPEGIKRTQVDDKPKRRVFDPEYKLAILERLRLSNLHLVQMQNKNFHT